MEPVTGMNPSNPSKESELEQLVRDACSVVPVPKSAYRQRLNSLLAQEYSRGLDAALSALPEKWKPKYEPEDSIAPNGWCGTCDALLGTDGECLCYVQNKAIDQAKSNIEKLKEPSND